MVIGSARTITQLDYEGDASNSDIHSTYRRKARAAEDG